MSEHTKGIIDWVAMGNVVITLIGWLPAIAAALSIVWTGIRIYNYFKTGEVEE